MEKSGLDHLLERYVRGEVSEAERAKIEAWLDDLGGKNRGGPDLSKEEEDRIFRKLTGNLTREHELRAPKRKVHLRPDQWILRAAASLIVVTVLAYTAWYLAGPREHELQMISKNGVEKIILSDGSLVWLREESKVMYYEKEDDGTRYATFEGVGLFEVSKDTGRPFIVQCGDARIKVLGTSFNIRSTDDIVEVTVLTGKVNLSSVENVNGIDLTPHEKAVYRQNGTFEKIQPSANEIATLTENTGYDMHFSNEEIGNVFARLEEKFNVSVKVSDVAIRNCRITIDLTDRSLDHSMRLVSEVLNFTYTLEGTTVAVSGHGCE